jgi:hypothetical protein
MWPIVAHLAVQSRKDVTAVDLSAAPDRLNSLFKDSQSTLVVTNNKKLSVASQWENSKARLINVDELDAGLDDQNLALAIDADRYLYSLPWVRPEARKAPSRGIATSSMRS